MSGSALNSVHLRLWAPDPLIAGFWFDLGPAKTLYNRWKRWSDNGVFARIMVGLIAKGAEHNRGSLARLLAAIVRMNRERTRSMPRYMVGLCRRLSCPTKRFLDPLAVLL